MFSEDPILLPEIVDQIVLVTVHPASEREDEELQRRRHSLRLLGRLDQHRPSLGRFFAPYAVLLCLLGGVVVERKIRFQVTSSLGKTIRVTEEHWQRIVTTKHPVMAGQEELVKKALTAPDKVRRSRKDQSVFLQYAKADGRYGCVVVKHLNGDGFVVTAYLTDRIKIGDPL